ncbi:TolC family protein [Caulobacter mirabilis]|uniref:Transporter n=1 Tax=Caulobacter mirabilis TaxID=69666 RepID=A0A2D2AY33_9CAUL|nr:TolC family protein [Caulobacter mirabilis]ATQ42914.1 transporter [Caulobacter mirabilis]
MPIPYRRPGRVATGCAAVAAATLLTGPVWAAPAPSYEALLKRRDVAPISLEAKALAEAADARVLQARARPNPTLSVDVENIYGSGANSGLSSAETTWTVGQNLELWNRRSSRIAAARADAGVAALQRDFALVDAAGRLATTYADAEAAQRRHALAQEALALTVEDARAALKLVEEGREPLLRGIQGEAEAAAARATLDEARAERDAAYARLTATALLETPVTVIDSSLLDQAPAIADETAAALPEVRIAQAERLAAERRIAVQRALGRPDLSASIGFRQSRADDSTAFTVGLSMPLPLFDRNRGNVQAAQADLRAAEARLTGVERTATADRAAAMARLAASSSRVVAADGGVKAAEEAYRLSRLGFEAGRISQLELRATRAALINARNAGIDARLARVRAETELARLQGRAPFGGVQ